MFLFSDCRVHRPDTNSQSDLTHPWLGTGYARFVRGGELLHSSNTSDPTSLKGIPLPRSLLGCLADKLFPQFLGSPSLPDQSVQTPQKQQQEPQTASLPSPT